jgi:exodeoxyribonuclease VII small subunit
MTYEEAYHELQEIVEKMEHGSIGVDELSAKVKRAAELIAFCKKKLQDTELDVAEVLKQLNEEQGNKGNG